MNVYGCNNKNIFMRIKMECSNQRGEAEFIKTFYLAPNENFLALHECKHSLFFYDT